MQEYTKEEIEEFEKAIDAMNYEELGTTLRFESIGSPYFRPDLNLYERLKKRFDDLGGWTAEMSKRIGWRS